MARLGIADPWTMPAGKLLRLLGADLEAEAAAVIAAATAAGSTVDVTAGQVVDQLLAVDSAPGGIATGPGQAHARRSSSSVDIERAATLPPDIERALRSPDPAVRTAARMREMERRRLVVQARQAAGQLGQPPPLSRDGGR